MTATVEQQPQVTSRWFPLRRLILLAFLGAALASGAYMARNALGLGGGSTLTNNSSTIESLSPYVVGRYVNVPIDDRTERLEIVLVDHEGVTVKDSDGDSWQCIGTVAAANCRPAGAPVPMPASWGNGFPTQADAMEECLAPRHVEPLYRGGVIAGYTCVKPIGE